MYVCMCYVCVMYVSMYVCKYVYMYVLCMYVCMYVYNMYACMHIHVHRYIIHYARWGATQAELFVGCVCVKFIVNS